MLKEKIAKILFEHHHSYWDKCVCGEKCIQDKTQSFEPQIHAHLAEKIMEGLGDFEARMDAVRKLHEPRATGEDYELGKYNQVLGVKMTYWCPECQVQFFSGDACPTMKALEGLK